jgi:hypothetical protein
MGTDDARRELLARLIDHAPMFPPASLAPAEALAEDTRAVASPHSFMLARLVWPASALDELDPSGDREISAVLDASLPARASVDAVEVRYRDDLGSLAELADDVFVEVSLDDALEERLDALAAHGLHAKVRCGGSAVPSVAALAQFVRSCRERGVGFKATAGLHHAVRTNGEHGFLNLLAAAVFAGAEVEALDETEADAFVVEAAALRWRDRSASAGEVTRARRDVLRSIGSCSFFEPVDELERLGVLAP